METVTIQIPTIVAYLVSIYIGIVIIHAITSIVIKILEFTVVYRQKKRENKAKNIINDQLIRSARKTNG